MSTHRQQSSNHNTTEGAILRHEVLTGIANQLSQATVRKSPIINCTLILLFHQLVPGPQWSRPPYSTGNAIYKYRYFVCERAIQYETVTYIVLHILCTVRICHPKRQSNTHTHAILNCVKFIALTLYVSYRGSSAGWIVANQSNPKYLTVVFLFPQAVRGYYAIGTSHGLVLIFGEYMYVCVCVCVNVCILCSKLSTAYV